jgi:ribonuclease E
VDAPEAVGVDEPHTEAGSDLQAAEAPVPEATVPRIHVPDATLGRDAAPAAVEAVVEQPVQEDAAAEGGEAEAGLAQPKKRTRRGSRGGRGRRKKPAEAGAGQESNGDVVAAVEAAETPEESPEADRDVAPARDRDAVTASDNGEEWGYVPMSEWETDFSSDPSRR